MVAANEIDRESEDHNGKEELGATEAEVNDRVTHRRCEGGLEARYQVFVVMGRI